MVTTLDRVTGCLYGIATGDAIGYFRRVELLADQIAYRDAGSSLAADV